MPQIACLREKGDWNVFRLFFRKFFCGNFCIEYFCNILSKKTWFFLHSAIFFTEKWAKFLEKICNSKYYRKILQFFFNVYNFFQFFKQKLTKKYAEKISEIFTIANNTTIFCGIFCNCKFYRKILRFFFNVYIFFNFLSKN